VCVLLFHSVFVPLFVTYNYLTLSCFVNNLLRTWDRAWLAVVVQFMSIVHS